MSNRPDRPRVPKGVSTATSPPPHPNNTNKPFYHTTSTSQSSTVSPSSSASKRQRLIDLNKATTTTTNSYNNYFNDSGCKSQKMVQLSSDSPPLPSNQPVWSSADFSLQKEIGDGNVGKVFKAMHLATKEFLALKFMSKLTIAKLDVLNQVKRELEVHTKLFQENILRAYGFYSTPNELVLICELSEKGNVQQDFSRLGPFSLNRAANLTRDMAQALAHLHRYNIVHRDIKPENILIFPDGYKLADFGLVTFIKNDEKKLRGRMTLCGTLDFMAPEVILQREYYTGVDIWGLGCLLYELLVGYAPFSDALYTNGLLNWKNRFIQETTPDVMQEMQQFDLLNNHVIKDDGDESDVDGIDFNFAATEEEHVRFTPKKNVIKTIPATTPFSKIEPFTRQRELQTNIQFQKAEWLKERGDKTTNSPYSLNSVDFAPLVHAQPRRPIHSPSKGPKPFLNINRQRFPHFDENDPRTWPPQQLTEKLTGLLPPQAAPLHQLKRIVTYDIHFPVGINKYAKDLLSKMLQFDPQRRITASEILKHEFVTRYCTSELNVITEHTQFMRNGRFSLIPYSYMEKYIIDEMVLNGFQGWSLPVGFPTEQFDFKELQQQAKKKIAELGERIKDTTSVLKTRRNHANPPPIDDLNNIQPNMGQKPPRSHRASIELALTLTPSKTDHPKPGLTDDAASILSPYRQGPVSTRKRRHGFNSTNGVNTTTAGPHADEDGETIDDLLHGSVAQKVSTFDSLYQSYTDENNFLDESLYLAQQNSLQTSPTIHKHTTPVPQRDPDLVQNITPIQSLKGKYIFQQKNARLTDQFPVSRSGDVDMDDDHDIFSANSRVQAQEPSTRGTPRRHAMRPDAMRSDTTSRSTPLAIPQDFDNGTPMVAHGTNYISLSSFMNKNGPSPSNSSSQRLYVHPIPDSPATAASKASLNSLGISSLNDFKSGQSIQKGSLNEKSHQVDDHDLEEESHGLRRPSKSEKSAKSAQFETEKAAKLESLAQLDQFDEQKSKKDAEQEEEDKLIEEAKAALEASRRRRATRAINRADNSSKLMRKSNKLDNFEKNEENEIPTPHHLANVEKSTTLTPKMTRSTRSSKIVDNMGDSDNDEGQEISRRVTRRRNQKSEVERKSTPDSNDGEEEVTTRITRSKAKVLNEVAKTSQNSQNTDILKLETKSITRFRAANASMDDSPSENESGVSISQFTPSRRITRSTTAQQKVSSPPQTRRSTRKTRAVTTSDNDDEVVNTPSGPHVTRRSGAALATDEEKEPKTRRARSRTETPQKTPPISFSPKTSQKLQNIEGSKAISLSPVITRTTRSQAQRASSRPFTRLESSDDDEQKGTPMRITRSISAASSKQQKNTPKSKKRFSTNSEAITSPPIMADSSDDELAAPRTPSTRKSTNIFPVKRVSSSPPKESPKKPAPAKKTRKIIAPVATPPRPKTRSLMVDNDDEETTTINQTATPTRKTPTRKSTRKTPQSPQMPVIQVRTRTRTGVSAEL